MSPIENIPMAWKPFVEGSTSLVGKLAAVMAAVERIPKRGRNEFHKYDYATEADTVETIRGELAKRSVMLFAAILDERREPVGDKGQVLTTLMMEMEFLDGQTGESIKKLWRGYGSDKDDKGAYKAMTGAEKYFLLKTFLMPTGDDPETDKTAKPKAGARPDPPETLADVATGEDVPSAAQPTPPKGYEYIQGCVLSDNQWYEVRLLNHGGTGTTKYSTKLQKLGAVAMQAYQDGVPVKITGKPAKRAGDFYLDSIVTLKPPQRDGAIFSDLDERPPIDPDEDVPF